MEERGWVVSSWGQSEKGKRAKFYKLNAAGKRALKAQETRWADYVAAVGKVMRASP
jgi:DNA-binding PadR family transcriptional regulator